MQFALKSSLNKLPRFYWPSGDYDNAPPSEIELAVCGFARWRS